jgi:hypothetical protein
MRRVAEASPRLWAAFLFPCRNPEKPWTRCQNPSESSPYRFPVDRSRAIYRVSVESVR